MDKQNSKKNEQAGFATAVEAAAWLRLSKAMVHKLIQQDEIPVKYYGRAVRIPWAWLRGQAEAR